MKGRLAPLPYVGYSLLITLIMFLIMFGMVFMMGAMEKMIGGDLQQAQAMIYENLGVPTAIAIIAISLLLMYASFNITFKRIRDMGLPVWQVMLGLILISIMLSYLFPGQAITINGASQFIPSVASSVFQLIVFLCLVVVPSNAFGKNNSHSS